MFKRQIILVIIESFFKYEEPLTTKSRLAIVFFLLGSYALEQVGLNGKNEVASSFGSWLFLGKNTGVGSGSLSSDS